MTTAVGCSYAECYVPESRHDHCAARDISPCWGRLEHQHWPRRSQGGKRCDVLLCSGHHQCIDGGTTYESKRLKNDVQVIDGIRVYRILERGSDVPLVLIELGEADGERTEQVPETEAAEDQPRSAVREVESGAADAVGDSPRALLEGSPEGQEVSDANKNSDVSVRNVEPSVTEAVLAVSQDAAQNTTSDSPADSRSAARVGGLHGATNRNLADSGLGVGADRGVGGDSGDDYSVHVAVSRGGDGPGIANAFPGADASPPQDVAALLDEDWSTKSLDELTNEFDTGSDQILVGLLKKGKAVAEHYRRAPDWKETADHFGVSKRTAEGLCGFYAAACGTSGLTLENLAPIAESRSLVQEIGRMAKERREGALETAIAHFVDKGEPPTVAALYHALGVERGTKQNIERYTTQQIAELFMEWPERVKYRTNMTSGMSAFVAWLVRRETA